MPGAAGRRVMLYLPTAVHTRAAEVLPASVSLSGLFRRALIAACAAAEGHQAAGHDLGDDPENCAECARFVNGEGVWA